MKDETTHKNEHHMRQLIFHFFYQNLLNPNVSVTELKVSKPSPPPFIWYSFVGKGILKAKTTHPQIHDSKEYKNTLSRFFKVNICWQLQKV